MAKSERIVAIGPREEMLGLRSVGIETVEADDAPRMLELLREQVRRPEARLVLVSETVAEGTREEMAELRDKRGTIIMLLPSHRGSKGMTLEWIKRAMEQSIGVDVISEKK